MAIQRQLSSVKPVNIHMEFGDLPKLASLKPEDQAALQKWYFEHTTVVQDAMQLLADEIDKLKATKSG
jgi:hypothetical protein